MLFGKMAGESWMKRIRESKENDELATKEEEKSDSKRERKRYRN